MNQHLFFHKAQCLLLLLFLRQTDLLMRGMILVDSHCCLLLEGLQSGPLREPRVATGNSCASRSNFLCGPWAWRWKLSQTPTHCRFGQPVRIAALAAQNHEGSDALWLYPGVPISSPE